MTEVFALLSSWRFFAGLAAVVLLTVCALAVMAQSPAVFRRYATLTAVQGAVEARSESGAIWHSIGLGARLGERQRLRASGDGAVVTLFDGSTLTLDPAAEVAFASVRSDLFGVSYRIVVRQDAGTVRYQANPLRSRQSTFEVQSPTAQIRAGGTDFEVIVEPTLTTRLTVLRGAVDVVGPLNVKVVKGGEAVTVSADAPVRLPASADPAAITVPGNPETAPQTGVDDPPAPTAQPTEPSPDDRTATPSPTMTPMPTPSAPPVATPAGTPEPAEQPTAIPAPTETPEPEPTEQPREAPEPERAPFIWPISGSSEPDLVNSPFGPRWQVTQNRYDYHGGLDLPAPEDTPVHVVADGIVSSAGWRSTGGGLTVLVYHPALDLYTAYLHLNAALVAEGQTLTQGEVLGLVGNTGSTNFMHLHFEVRVSTSNYRSSTRNPMRYLPRPDVDAPSIDITALDAHSIRSPTVSLMIAALREELDVNQVRVIIEDLATGAVVDDQMVDLNERLHTGSDSLDQDGIRLIPSPFNSWTPQYELAVEFYQLRTLGPFALTAEVVDLSGNVSRVVATVDGPTLPAEATSPGGN